MRDSFGRTMDYLRVSITDRCNLRCQYCMPAEGVEWLPPASILSFEEIVEVATISAGLGFHKLRLTGGEPLVRSGVVELVAMLAKVEGITDLSMTTNGTRLDRYAKPLNDAGLHRLNISLDTMDPKLYQEITMGGDINRVFAGIKAAQQAGFDRIKLNVVVLSSSNEDNAKAVAKYGAENNIETRFIRKMDLAKGEFWQVEGGSGGDCSHCGRLRLTCEGMIRPCLFSDLGFSVRELGAEEAIRRAVGDKPASGEQCLENTFSRIGG